MNQMSSHRPRLLRTRSLVIALPFGALAACGGTTTTSAAGDGGTSDAQSGAHVVGAPCRTLQEAEPTFVGFTEQEVSVEDYVKTAPGTDVCLVNHFRGRASCPYGQDTNGVGPSGAPSCKTTTGQPVTGNSAHGAAVPAQCTDRLAADTVHWSCRCANADGKTNDGDTYCACPSGMTCAQLVASIGGPDTHLAGAYCIHANAAFNRASSCSASCDPAAHPCP